MREPAAHVRRIGHDGRWHEHVGRRLARSRVDRPGRRRRGRSDDRGWRRGRLVVSALRRRLLLRAERVRRRHGHLRRVLEGERPLSGRLGLLRRAEVQLERRVRELVHPAEPAMLARGLLPRQQVLVPRRAHVHSVQSARNELLEQRRVLLEQLRERRLRRERAPEPRSRQLSGRSRELVARARSSSRDRRSSVAGIERRRLLLLRSAAADRLALVVAGDRHVVVDDVLGAVGDARRLVRRRLRRL